MSTSTEKQYDSIAPDFAKSGVHERRIYLESYGFFRLLGDLNSLDILDLACGHGYYTRPLKQRGARRVVGLDLSTEMLAVGRAAEAQDPIGVEFICGDVCAMEVIGSFDLVTAAYLLQYCQTRAQLDEMCRRIYANIKPGGRFATILTNPETDWNDLGLLAGEVKLEMPDPLQEGDRIHMEIQMNTKVGFDFWYWKPATYRRALEEAGFTSVLFSYPELSPETGQRLGQAFVDYSLRNPGALFITARRPA